MIKNGKYFVPPTVEDVDFKTLFRRLASAGAGRPVDEDGFPLGPWTSDSLAEAISQIDANKSGIELRTVQLWFQDNDKGISPDNIRWLARIFGCDDPDATSAWQAELSAAQTRLSARRRQRLQRETRHIQSSIAAQAVAGDTSLKAPQHGASTKASWLFTLPRASEALFTRRSPLDTPSSVFAGAAALGMISYFLGLHSVTYAGEGGGAKQVGFLWAPNWTVLFMILLPLFIAFTAELASHWKVEGRALVSSVEGDAEIEWTWLQKIYASTFTYWSAFLVCLCFAGVLQWVSVRVLPMLRESDEYAIDWGSVPIAHPEILPTVYALAFTGFAYLYMSLCFYIFFAGLILLFTIVHDFYEIERTAACVDKHYQRSVAAVRYQIIRGLFRCAILGALIAICMKLQSVYLITDAENILTWLKDDALSVLSRETAESRGDFSMPNQYTSFLTALAAYFVFIHGLIRLRPFDFQAATVKKMVVVASFVGAAYLLIGAFEGFSIVLGIAVLLAVYCLFDPSFGASDIDDYGAHRGVS